MVKMTIIGAGSAEFATELMTDVLSTPGLPTGIFALVDVDPIRLELAHQVGEHLIERTGRDWKIESSTERADMMPGTDYLINTIEVHGLANVRHDYDIPMKYGIDQCIGDTIGPGGLFKALRTLPAWIEILADAKKFCPRATIFNYTNPMSLTVLTGSRVTDQPIYGLCHSITHTVEELAGFLGIPVSELTYRSAGVNHLSWILDLEHQGVDVYPRLHELAENPEIAEQDLIRFETMKQLGAFPTETSGHSSEYTQFFRKRPDLVEKYARSGYRGESGFYANNWPTWRAEADEILRQGLSGGEPIEIERGAEYASYIMDAIENDEPCEVYVNVPNRHTGSSDRLVDNLPLGATVEVRATIDGDGIHPQPFGSLPTHLANLDHVHTSFHDLVADSIINQDREAAVHALMIDPLTSAVCSLAEIRAMFDEMVEAEKEYLPAYLSETDSESSSKNGSRKS